MNSKWLRSTHRLIYPTAFLVAFLLATAACGNSDTPEDSKPSIGRSPSSAAKTAGSTSPTARPGSTTTGETSREPLQPTASNLRPESVGQDSSPSAGASDTVGYASPTPDPTPSPTPGPTPGERDRAALIAFYQATNGDNWQLNRRWLSDEPLDQWQGVTTNQEGAVTGLSLPNNRLTGELPPEFGHLLSLTELDLSENKLSGELPSEFDNLLSLTKLDLSENQLTACIPVRLYYEGKLPGTYDKESLPFGSKEPTITACPEPDRENLSAVFRAMKRKQHPGPIGTWPGVRVDKSGHVKTLKLSLTGERPAVVPELARLSKLQVLSLSDASGEELPPELGTLSNLRHLSITDSDLTGEIPPELGNLSNLTQLSLVSNQLSGEIPAELAKLSKLVSLKLSDTQLSGEIPAELGQLSNLRYALLWGNSLSGCIPSNWPVSVYRSLPLCSAASGRISQQQADQEFRALAALLEDVRGESHWERGATENWLSDKPLGEWKGVRTDDNGYVVGLFLDQTLQGTLPAELGDLTYLRTLSLWPVHESSTLTGGIPQELGNLSHLINLTIVRSNTVGSIPKELGNLSNLKVLSLSSNQLTGEIPKELGNLSNLQVLRLSVNQLTGEIPRELGNLTELQHLNLRVNQLDAEIPLEVWDLPKLEYLYLNLSGCIPAKLKHRLLEAHPTMRFC